MDPELKQCRFCSAVDCLKFIDIQVETVVPGGLILSRSWEITCKLCDIIVYIPQDQYNLNELVLLFAECGQHNGNVDSVFN